MNGEKPAKIDLKELKEQTEIAIHNMEVGICVENVKLKEIKRLIEALEKK